MSSSHHTTHTARGPVVPPPVPIQGAGYRREHPLVPLSHSPTATNGVYDPRCHEAKPDSVRHVVDASLSGCQVTSTSVIQSGERWAEAEAQITIKISPALQLHQPRLAHELAQKLTDAVKEALAGCDLAKELIRDELTDGVPPRKVFCVAAPMALSAEEQRKLKKHKKNLRAKENRRRRREEEGVAAAAAAAKETKTPPTPSADKAQQEPTKEAPRLIVSAPPPPQAALPPLTGPPPRSAGMGALEEWWKVVRMWHPEIPPGDGPFRTMADATYHSQVGLRAYSLYAFLDWLPQPKEEPLEIGRFNFSDSGDEDPTNQYDSGADTEPIEGFANKDS